MPNSEKVYIGRLMIVSHVSTDMCANKYQSSLVICVLYINCGGIYDFNY